MNYADWYTDRMTIRRVKPTKDGALTRHEREQVAEDVPCRIYRSNAHGPRMQSSAIDAVFGSHLADAVGGWRSNVQGWADSFGENEIKIQRMEKIQYDDAWDRGSRMGRSAGAALDNFSIQDYMVQPGGTGFDYDALTAASGLGGTLSGIGEDTRAIRNSVALSEEDMKLLVDLAEREYVNNIHLTAQTPVINITGQNTGDTELDKQALADALRDILIEQAASHTDLAYT